MKKIHQIISDDPRYKRYKKPMQAARVCEAARVQGNGRFGAVSFRDGLLCLSISSSTAAANLQAQNQKIIDELNQKLGQEIVKRIRFKIE